jgi:parallel beta-helix repeat protein
LVGGAWTWGGWYCSEYGNGKLWKVDYDSGYMFEIGGDGVHLNGLAWGEIGILLGSTNTSLYEINEYSGEQTYIGSFDLPEGSRMGSITIDCNYRRFYGVEYSNNGLYEFDPETCDTAYIGSLGIDINDNAVLAHCCEDGYLYLSTFTDQGELYKVDKDTGECTLVGEFQGGAEISALIIDSYRGYLPTADFTWGPRYIQPGETIEFNASSSHTENSEIILYEWDWNNDLIFDESSDDPIIEYMWEETGYYPVTLLVWDNDNNMDSQQYTVYVGNTFYVGGSGPGNYTKIQDAIDNASDGDTVFVCDGTYYENIEINKSINLKGEYKNCTIIFGNGNTDTILITANQVYLNNFTIKNGFGIWKAGVKIYSENNTIRDNIMTDNNIGIYSHSSNNNNYIKNLINNSWLGIILRFNSNNNLIFLNEIYNNSLGCGIDGDNNIFKGNFINNCTDGIGIRGDKNIIRKNNISENRDTGISVNYGNLNNISDNNIKSNRWYGLIFGECGKNTIFNNTIMYNSDGISILSCNNITIQKNLMEKNYRGIKINSITDNVKHIMILGNTITKNEGYGIILIHNNSNCTIFNNIIDSNYRTGIDFCSNTIENHIISENSICSNGYYGIEIRYQTGSNLLYHNNFINNTYKNVIDIGNNTWDNDYPSGGNYWDDYIGEDNNSDGIGDTPYQIPGGDNEDRYPFMKPNGWNNTRPNQPIITGPTNGRKRVWYEFNFSISDPDGDLLWIHIDWEHGTPSKWAGPFPSGSIVKYNYSWRKKDSYTIRAQTRDSKGLLSEWGTLEVMIPRTRVSTDWYTLFLDRFPILAKFFSFFCRFYI